VIVPAIQKRSSCYWKLRFTDILFKWPQNISDNIMYKTVIYSYTFSIIRYSS